MIIKNINNIFLIASLLFLFSCENIDKFSFKYKDEDEDKYNVNFEQETESLIDISSYYKFNFDKQDYFLSNNYNTYLFNKNIKHVHTFKVKKNKKSEITKLKLIIDKNYIFRFDLNSNLLIYDIKNFNIVKNINILKNIKKSDIFPVSFSFYNDLFYVSYSDGNIICFNSEGVIQWSYNYLDIFKTPIKLLNDQIIILLSNKILSLDPKNGFVNWEYKYEGDNLLKFNGGDLVSSKNLLFFILPNNMIGEVDTIFGEENSSVLSDISFQNSISNSNDKLHTYKNLLSYFDQNKFLTTINISENKIVLNSSIISNVNSFIFYNNSLITVDLKLKLSALNITNNKLFFQTDISEFISDNDLLINVANSNSSIVFFFQSGKIIEINNLSGKIINFQNTKINHLNMIYFSNDFIILNDKNGKISLFKQ